jgi:hypothetical protein
MIPETLLSTSVLQFEKMNVLCYVHFLEITDHSGRAVQGMKCLRTLEHWDRGFESMSALFCVCVVLYR